MNAGFRVKILTLQQIPHNNKNRKPARLHSWSRISKSNCRQCNSTPATGENVHLLVAYDLQSTLVPTANSCSLKDMSCSKHCHMAGLVFLLGNCSNVGSPIITSCWSRWCGGGMSVVFVGETVRKPVETNCVPVC